jgi:hypothetical protein
LDQLVAAAKAGDQKKVDDLGKEIGKSGNKLGQQLKADARGVEDPMRKKQLLKAADELQNLLPNELDEAKTLSKNPSDANAQKKLGDTDKKLHDVLSSLVGPKADLQDAVCLFVYVYLFFVLEYDKQLHDVFVQSYWPKADLQDSCMFFHSFVCFVFIFHLFGILFPCLFY